MNKVFSYAKIAGICVTVCFIISLALTFLKKHGIITNITLEFVCCAIWVVFFALLIKASAKQSPIVTPSWIAIVGYIIAFASTSVSNYASHLIIGEEPDWDAISNLFKVSSTLYYIESAAICIAFLWLSKYFSKGSALKVLAIIIGIVAIVHPVLSYFIQPWKIDNESTQIIVRICESVFWSVAVYVPAILFFFDFSKLKK